MTVGNGGVRAVVISGLVAVGLAGMLSGCGDATGAGAPASTTSSTRDETSQPPETSAVTTPAVPEPTVTQPAGAPALQHPTGAIDALRLLADAHNRVWTTGESWALGRVMRSEHLLVMEDGASDRAYVQHQPLFDPASSAMDAVWVVRDGAAHLATHTKDFATDGGPVWRRTDGDDPAVRIVPEPGAVPPGVDVLLDAAEDVTDDVEVTVSVPTAAFLQAVGGRLAELSRLHPEVQLPASVDVTLSSARDGDYVFTAAARLDELFARYGDQAIDGVAGPAATGAEGGASYLWTFGILQIGGPVDIPRPTEDEIVG